MSFTVVLQGEELWHRAEELGRRGREAVAREEEEATKEEQRGEVANINIIVGWAEVALVLVAATTNVSSVDELRERIARLQAAQVQT